ncbi:MAG TPA: hypothetical protein PK771_12370, partial [Spirochaetota bacterium]|nr:hypothetical protein [Spirochaetota bacterium]
MFTNNKIWIVDKTLRDGEQAAKVVFSCEEKIAIAKMLSETGVHEIEVGTPAIGSFEVDNIKSIARLNLDSRLTAWCRANKKDIDMALESNADIVHISFPASKLHIASLDTNEEQLLENLEVLITYAKNHFEFVSIGFQDVGRSSQNLLMRFIDAAVGFGANRVRLADTVGILNPSKTFQLISNIKSTFRDIIIDFHGHNDLGMATANALSAYEAGANCLSVTVNGLGERAGNTPLEEIVMALKYSLGIECDIKTENFTKLSKMVSEYSGIVVAPNKPVVGRNIFRHESGIHCKGMLFDRNSYELFHPEDVGGKEEDF